VLDTHSLEKEAVRPVPLLAPESLSALRPSISVTNLRPGFSIDMTFRYASLGLLLSVSVGLLTAQVQKPRVGVVRFSNGETQLVFGLGGNYVLERSPLDGIERAGFSDQAGLIASRSTLTLLDVNLLPISKTELREANPLLNVTGSASSAIAWLPSSHQVLHWNGSMFTAVGSPDLSSQNSVTWIEKSGPDTASLLVLNAQNEPAEVRVSLQNGQILEWKPLTGVQGPCFRQGTFIVSFENRQIIVSSDATGILERIPLPADALVVEHAASDCLHLHSLSGNRDWMLHADGNQFELYELPRPKNGSSGQTAERGTGK